MKTTKRKGFGLVMAIMIVTVLLIMALGFFQVTDYSTKSTHKNLNDLKLYWAVESASNYNVNWWVNQEETVRIDWPSEYVAPDPVEESKSSANAYADENNYQTKASVFEKPSESKSSANPYPDENSYPVKAYNFEKASGIATDDLFYLHASSVLEHPNFKIDGYEIITVRYKGERKDHEGDAVWILDSYAWDTATGNLANITLTNVFNETYDAELDWLANSENIVRSMYATGFNGALGAFHEKDVRYGPTYYADLMRFDLQTGGSTGARFYKGPVKNSLVQANPSFAYHQSRWGNAEIDNMTGLFDPTHQYGYGMSIKANYANQNEAAAAFATILNNGNTPYFKDEPALPTDNVTWTWADVVNDGESEGLYMLPDGSGNVTVRLIYDSDNGTTVAKVTGGHEAEISLGGIKGIAVPQSYGTVNLGGVSNEDFTLITENNQVIIGDHFYIADMQDTFEDLSSNTGYIDQNETPEWLLAKLWESMGNTTSTTKLSVISQLNTEVEPNGTPFHLPQKGRLYFTTAAFLCHDGFLSVAPNFNSSNAFVNIGSLITLNYQSSSQGDASAAWTKALIQDYRYDPASGVDMGIPAFWGPGPDVLEQYSRFGLNKEHSWSKGSVQKTNNWNNVVWKTGYTPNF